MGVEGDQSQRTRLAVQREVCENRGGCLYGNRRRNVVEGIPESGGLGRNGVTAKGSRISSEGDKKCYELL